MLKKILIKPIFIPILLIIFIVIPASYARYTYFHQGDTFIDIAKWDVTINNNPINSDFTFDLFETVNNDNLKKDVKLIAPGTNGSLSFYITNDSDVVAEYTILIEEVENDKDIPIVYSLEEDGEYKELSELVIASNEEIQMGVKNKKVTLYWKWDFYHDKNQNIKDTEIGLLEDATILIHLNIKANQKLK